MDKEALAFYSAESWDERYAETDRRWSGNPNRRLVEQVEGLTAGTVLDVGCGEGADAVWLAQQGWQVTAIDVSQVALDRAAKHAEEAGVPDLVDVRRVDLMGGGEVDLGTFDLVSSFFFHPPEEFLDGFHQLLARAVAPGGRLLVVAHHPDHRHNTSGDHGPAVMFTPQQVVAALDPQEWEIECQEVQRRDALHHGKQMTLTDTVVLARRSV